MIFQIDAGYKQDLSELETGKPQSAMRLQRLESRQVAMVVQFSDDLAGVINEGLDSFLALDALFKRQHHDRQNRLVRHLAAAFGEENRRDPVARCKKRSALPHERARLWPHPAR
jgi:hypothetical protein